MEIGQLAQLVRAFASHAKGRRSESYIAQINYGIINKNI